MEKLNFPNCIVELKNRKNKTYLFDKIRKKWVLGTLEEWVRIHCLIYFTDTLGYPTSWIKVENEIKLYNTRKRFDIMIVNPDNGNLILVECKSPKVKLDQKVFDQIARYNLQVRSQFIMLTNGLNHYFCKMDYKNQQYLFIKKIPKYRSY